MNHYDPCPHCGRWRAGACPCQQLHRDEHDARREHHELLETERQP